MSTIATPVPPSGPTLDQNLVDLFSPRLIWLWLATGTLATALTLLSLSHPLRSLVAVCYGLWAVCFFALGFIGPLAFRSLKGVVLSLGLSLLGATVVEIMMCVLRESHQPHFLELLSKLLLLTIGFGLALDCRYQKSVRLGPLQIGFSSDKH